MDIGYFLKLMTEKNASDMFLSTGAPVHIKVEGKLYPLGNTGLPLGMVKKIAYSLMDEGQVPLFERDLELNMALALPDTGRFRVNVFKQRGEVGLVIRAIRSVIPSIEELQLPQVLKDIIMAPRGLVLIVGSTGSGKSTTLASMIDYRNSGTPGHILTIEDPIEYLHKHKKSIVNQREVGLDGGWGAGDEQVTPPAPRRLRDGGVGSQDLVDATVASDSAGQRALWAYREQHTEAIGAAGVPVKLDVSVPTGRLPELCDRLNGVIAGVLPAALPIVFGHVNEGNLHVNVLGAGSSATEVTGAVLQLVAELSGSI
ncbi:MAG: Flp pilus assembly complex ATPase component TadA, partial [Proteobacteria bacterium]|nr:Flp pilus assembly complex ATPase component TadA [Pseudomonadota bacterium]